MKATLVHSRYGSGSSGGLGLSRREALVVTGVLISLTAYLTALFLLI